MNADDILHFWFDELSARDHFKKSAALDARMRQRFSTIHAAASRGELYTWRVTPDGRLAEIIILDQFSRNMFRDDPRAFAQDDMALVLAQELLATGMVHEFSPVRRAFAYMPFMHSESAVIHKLAHALFSEAGLEDQLKYEIMHKAIIDRFGRYPHRNKVLGRESTAAELAFLQEPNSSF